MWQYNYTAIDNSNYLKHYKYIRKYQKNGHTYYVYDDSEYKQNAEKADSARKIINRLGKNGYIDSDGYKNRISTKNGLIYTHSRESTGYGQGIKDKSNEKIIKKSAEIAKNHAIQTIKDIPRRIHAKGLSAVSNILRRLRKD